MENSQLQELLDFARSTLEDGGEIALNHFRTSLDISNKRTSGFDPVTAADREIESFIRDRIKSAYPEHGIVGEEEGIQKGADSINWYIDPIDGTRSFISGNPLWGILLGLKQGKDCKFGLVHQPFLQETFIGSNLGGYLYTRDNQFSLSTSSTSKLEDAIVYCTHPDVFDSDKDLQAFLHVAGQCRLMRYGGDCYSYCLLAHGQIDLVIEASLKPHDIVPLIPIIESAGGMVTDWQGNNAETGGRILAAASTELHEKALTQLAVGTG